MLGKFIAKKYIYMGKTFTNKGNIGKSKAVGDRMVFYYVAGAVSSIDEDRKIGHHQNRRNAVLLII